MLHELVGLGDDGSLQLPRDILLIKNRFIHIIPI